MSCDSEKLELYLDGELQGSERAAVKAHLDACAGCRAELEKLEKLEGLLVKAEPKIVLPFNYEARLVTRARRPAWGPRIYIGAAAAALLIAAVWLLAGVRTPPVNHDPAADAKAALEQLVQAKTEPEREAAREILRRAGPAAIEKAVNDPAVAKGIWTGIQKRSPQVSIEDLTPSAPVAISMPEVESLAEKGETDRVLETLRPAIGRGGDPTVQQATAKWVAVLLRSPKPELQKLALDILNDLDGVFPYSALVDVIDAPEGVGERALKMLREGTGEDFSTQKEWRSYFEKKM